MEDNSQAQQAQQPIDTHKPASGPSTPSPPLTSTSAETVATPSSSSKKILIGIFILVFFLIILGIGGFFLLSQRKTLDTTKQISPKVSIQTPYDKLIAAVEKTKDVDTLYLEYKTKVTSRISSAKTGVTQTLNNNVDGYITGSTDGKVGKMELRIYSDLDPSKSVNMTVMNTEDGSWYLKTAATAPKWQKFTKEEYDKLDEEQPNDASLYGINILATIFSENKALFKSFQKDWVENLGDEIIGDKAYAKYRVEISTTAFINALSQDDEISPRDIEDARIILEDAVITATFFIDKEMNYIKRIKIIAKNLTQIPTPESQQLGISTTHDIDLTADLSRFNLPTEITPPDPSEIIESSTNI